eukprot:UN22814
MISFFASLKTSKNIWEGHAALQLFYVYTSSESCPSEVDDDAGERLKFNECMQLGSVTTQQLFHQLLVLLILIIPLIISTPYI